MTVSYVLYVMSLILFGFLLQSVISNIIIAIVVSIFWIYIPAQALSVLPVNRALYGTLCLVSPFDFMFLTFKKATESLSTNSIIPVATNDLGYPWLVSILFVDCVIYGLAAWYVNEIKTGDYGVSKPWNFPFKKSYWFPSTAPQESQRLIDEGAADEQNQDMFEDNSETQMGVVVANLKKIYTQHNATPVLAVRGINAGFGRDKITALLGHNGAGKSTTINMLVGLITPTSGDAVIEGKSILTHMDEIRNHIGICPQEDFLFPDLTAPEHLRLVARLRGYTSPTLKEDINAALANIGLPESDHKNMRTKKFSGGMKRKLSLAIALFGNPSVVVLDEPTTGIDAASKRAIWDTFTREKEGKTIILTTHSMEEADALSDHIYIMSDGQLKCGGSSMFLKNKFGTGYYVNFEKRQNFSSEAVLGIVKKHIPDAAVYNETAEVAVLTVPFGHTQLFPTVFRELDAKKDQLGIKSYGLSLTTLEDVFVRMGTDRETTGLNHEAHIPRVTSEDNNRANEKDGEDDEEDSNNEKKIIFDDSCPPPSSVGRQFATVLFVNWLFYVRRKIRTAVILGLPVLLIAIFVLPSKVNKKWRMTTLIPVQHVHTLIFIVH